MDPDEALLESLLAVATEELEKIDDNENFKKSATSSPNRGLIKSDLKSKTPKKVLKEADIFQFESNLKLSSPKNSVSIIHNGDTDSSDEEGNRNYEDQKYNQTGREIRNLMKSSHDSAIETNSISSSHYGLPKKRISSWKTHSNTSTINASIVTSPSLALNPKPMFGKLPEAGKKFQDVFMDPIFGMRIVNPLISSTLLIDRMQGRLAVRYSDLSAHLFAGNLKDKDWVICGVVVNKSPPKTSSKGSQFSLWTLSDLKDDIKTFSLFMFSSAHKDLWKTAVGTVIGVLNPSIMDQKDGAKKDISLSINNAQKVMVFGQSKDFGICKSMKKNGDKCTAVVNLSRCEYCIYHIKQEYQKCSKQSELQANFAGQGLVNLRNKVLGKNEVFYAGKSYMAIPAKKSKKLEAKDQNILQNLNASCISVKPKNVPKNKKGVARHLDVNPAQRARDLKLLQKLGGSTDLESKTNFSGNRSDEVSLEDSKATALSVINKLKAKESQVKEPVNKNSQYNLKSDLFVNVEDKNTFSCVISEQVTLEESKNQAIAVISKLKAKSKNPEKNKTEEIIGTNNQNLLSIEEIEEQLNSEDLKYSDDEGKVVSVRVCTDPILSTVPPKLPPSMNNLTDPLNNVKINSLNQSIKERGASNSPKSMRNDVFVKQLDDVLYTPKSIKSNSESFGKISPKLSETKINPNSNVESETLLILSTPRSTPGEVIKRHNKNGTPSGIKSTNLKHTFSNNIKASTSINQNGLVVANDEVHFNKHENSTKVSVEFNDSNSISLSQYSNSEGSFLDKTVSGLKSVSGTQPDLDKMSMNIPMLPGFKTGDLIDLDKPITTRHVDRAKVNAIKFIQRNGPIKKVDPNSTKGLHRKKRNIDSVLGRNNENNSVSGNTVNEHSAAKKSKLQESEFISDRFKKMMAMTSKYANLLEQHDDKEKEKYFKKLEVKECMEEKMTNTHKLKCKAVRCLQCKYTSFSASELCKKDRHPLKVFDAMKRFYKCSNCQNRTVTLELIPTRPCNNCGSSKWVKTGMMKEKIALVQHNLSIRGGEQKFVNSVVADANLDLLVPDD